ncbi:MAG: ANTAR domain-containing protein [Nocardioides sp.]
MDDFVSLGVKVCVGRARGREIGARVDEQAFGAVTEAVRAIDLQPDSTAALDEIVAQAQRCLPEFEHVSLWALGPAKSMRTLAATSELARSLDKVQATVGKGPCVEAIVGDEIVTVRHARHEQRWPKNIGEAVALGLRSQLAVRIPGHGPVSHALNLYSTSHDDLDPGSIGVAEHFAVHAGIALGRVRQEEQLRTSIGTRTLIGTAVGILMERFGMSQAHAFDYLVRRSSTENRKLRLVAADLVAEKERSLEHQAD